MKRLSLILLLVIGCISSNPELTIINQQQIIGDWALSKYIVNGLEIPAENKDALSVRFLADGTCSGKRKGTVQPHSVTLRYTIEGSSFSLLMFKNNKFARTIKAKIEFNNDFIYFSNIKIKPLSGEMDVRKMWPGLKDYQLIFQNPT